METCATRPATLLAWLTLFGALCTCTLFAAPRDQSPIITQARDGRLAYDADERGNRVPDFSHCGYAGGDRAVPDAPVRMVVEPKRGDSTARIQQALDYVGTLPPDTNGLRGAVLLLRGRHEVFGGLLITNSGVVLRGQGMGETGTVLIAAGLDRRTLIRIVGQRAPAATTTTRITDEYVPVGATTLHVQDSSALRPMSLIRLIRPSTAAWIEQLGASDFGGGVGGGWKPGTRDIVWERVVKSIEGNKLTLDAPLTTALENRDAAYVAQTSKSAVSPVSKPANAANSNTRENGGRPADSEIGDTAGLETGATFADRLTNVGIENLRLESVYDTKNPKDENHSWCAITMEHVRDAWVRQVTFKHFSGSAVALWETASRVTVEDCLSLAPVSEDGGGRRNTFHTAGQQTLFLRCFSERGRHDFSVGHCAAGPNAFVQCEAAQSLRDSGPIGSWASGVLFDNVRIDGQSLTLGNRGPRHGGVGWAAANSVLWNCSASRVVCASPPGARNWSFGSWAEFEGDGVWRSSNDFMQPESLYVVQLRDRLGADAAKRVQLMPRPKEESSNPPLEKAQELAAASHQPAPLLADYITKASKRNPISSEAIGAPASSTARSGGEVKRAVLEAGAPLLITNGWLTISGKLLIGGSASVAWWRGNARPAEQTNFNLALTRFVPGRIGHGFTDDLRAVADSLVASNRAALDHNYGLWYDRRRDDHERVRRMDGDVWPPFFEQPFARSGTGTAWDGLSQYDLTKFNPWYWSRLREFADIADEHGLVLFHQNYFQHNILEAGAHWADSPWRSANNINNTGFPEPPPYAGDKRIFMAELFYDVNHTVRRELHRRYIRQCLDNFAGQPNVIQFTSAEFTGPKHFVEFWLDTVAEWERKNVGDTRRLDSGVKFKVRNPIIALSATKDVQDAILADRKRAAVVDVIDFRYWWRTAKGEFAPPGGKNLAPRQFERQWRGGRPTDTDLAAMASEYRAKFPGKPVICDFDAAGWAWLCAGGSQPRLPRTTDTSLLAAIPQLKPWQSDSAAKRWALREAGRQILAYCDGRAELDLSGETGVFNVALVDRKTGQLKPQREMVRGGGLVRLPGDEGVSVVWLRKERQ